MILISFYKIIRTLRLKFVADIKIIIVKNHITLLSYFLYLQSLINKSNGRNKQTFI